MIPDKCFCQNDWSEEDGFVAIRKVEKPELSPFALDKSLIARGIEGLVSRAAAANIGGALMMGCDSDTFDDSPDGKDGKH